MIISRWQVINFYFLIKHITPIAEGVEFAEGIGQGAGGGKGLAPGVVGVGDDFRARIIQNGNDNALEVMDVGEFLGGSAVIPFHHGGISGGCMFLFAV